MLANSKRILPNSDSDVLNLTLLQDVHMVKHRLRVVTAANELRLKVSAPSTAVEMGEVGVTNSSNVTATLQP